MAKMRKEATSVQVGEASYIDLYNHSQEPQHIFVESEGRRYSIPQQTVMAFPRDIAQQFLEDCTRWVRPFTNMQIPEGRPGMPLVWMANVTGNPFIASEIQVDRMEHGEKTVLTLPNPIRTPQTLLYEVHRDQERMQVEDGEMFFNHAPTTIVWPPYRREAVPANLGMMLETRDSNQDENHRGKIIRCRAPSAFEPDDTWTYDELRIYAGTVAPQYFELEKAWPEGKQLDDTQLDERKIDLLHHLFFVLISDKFNLPSREQFTAIWKTVENVEAAA